MKFGASLTPGDWESKGMTTVLVTGSSGGLGSATVGSFMSAGYEVVGLDRVPPPSNPGYRHIDVDVSDEASMRRALEDVGPLRHVIALVGGALMAEKAAPDVADLPIQVVRESIELNLISAFVTLRVTLPKLRLTAGDRSLTFVSSTDALLSYGLPGYASAKSGIMGLVRSLAHPLGREGIRINAIAPGDIPTERGIREWAHLPNWYENLATTTALGRLCRADELGDSFLSVAARMTGLTGQVVVVDAGLSVSGAGVAVPQA